MEQKNLNVEAAVVKLEQVKSEIAKAFIGQNQLVNNALITLIAGGHLLDDPIQCPCRFSSRKARTSCW